MSFSKYLPVYEMNKLLKGYAKEFHHTLSCAYSMWAYDKENNKLVICTTSPGFWIGCKGSTMEKILVECNALINQQNEIIKASAKKHHLPENAVQLTKPLVGITFIECEY